MKRNGAWPGGGRKSEADSMSEHERNKRIRVERERKLRKELRRFREDVDEEAAELLRRLRA